MNRGFDRAPAALGRACGTPCLRTAKPPENREQHSDGAGEMRDSRERRQRWQDFDTDELTVLPAAELRALVEDAMRWRRWRARHRTGRPKGRPSRVTDGELIASFEKWRAVRGEDEQPLGCKVLYAKIADVVGLKAGTVANRIGRLRKEGRLS